MRNLRRLYIGLTIILMVIGLLLIFNASSFVAVRTKASYDHFFNLHLVKVIVGILVIIGVALIPYDYYKKYSKQALIGVIFLLLLTFFFGVKIKGAHRWIGWGIMKFQPSELAKLVLIIHLSKLLVMKEENINSIRNGLGYLLFWVLLVAVLIYLQPNVSTSIIIVFTSFVLFYVGGVNFTKLMKVAVPLAISGSVLAMLFSHSRSRIMMYYQSITSGKEFPQVVQAKIALGSGGLLGVGLGQSRQSNGFVPEAYGDFIFSILGEELGFIGAVFVLLIYVALFVIGIMIAKRVADKFAQLVVFGISFNILFGAFVNIAVVLGAIPTTGITLPFMSYGGTSLFIGCISVGIVTNIAKSGQTTTSWSFNG